MVGWLQRLANIPLSVSWFFCLLLCYVSCEFFVICDCVNCAMFLGALTHVGYSMLEGFLTN